MDEEGQGLARFEYMEIGILSIWRSSQTLEESKYGKLIGGGWGLHKRSSPIRAAQTQWQKRR